MAELDWDQDVHHEIEDKTPLEEHMAESVMEPFGGFSGRHYRFLRIVIADRESNIGWAPLSSQMPSVQCCPHCDYPKHINLARRLARQHSSAASDRRV